MKQKLINFGTYIGFVVFSAFIITVYGAGVSLALTIGLVTGAFYGKYKRKK